jgi:hypothetical protein
MEVQVSWVTDVLISCSLMEEVYDDEVTDAGRIFPVEEVNAWLEHEGKARLVRLDDFVSSRCSGRSMGMVLHGGAYNYLDVDRFVKFVLSRQWQERDALQLLTRTSDEHKFVVHELGG